MTPRNEPSRWGYGQIRMITLRLLRRPVIRYLDLASEEAYDRAKTWPRGHPFGETLRADACKYDDAISSLVITPPSRW